MAFFKSTNNSPFLKIIIMMSASFLFCLFSDFGQKNNHALAGSYSVGIPIVMKDKIPGNGVGPGGAITSPNFGTEGTLDILPGNGSSAVLSWDVHLNTWKILGNTPSPTGAGGAISNLFNKCDFAFAGGGSKYFFSTGKLCNSPKVLSDAPGPVNSGGAIATAPGLGGAPSDLVFALRGGGTTDFWRYSISQNSWTILPGTPGPVYDGGAIVEVPGTSFSFPSAYWIAALQGGNTTNFWRYNIDQNSWSNGPSLPAPVGPGGSIAQKHRIGHVYVLRGGGSSDFWRLDDTWTWVPLASTPGPVNAGGSLVSINYGSLGDILYALQGGGSPAIWRYSDPNNTWTHVTDIPNNIAVAE